MPSLHSPNITLFDRSEGAAIVSSLRDRHLVGCNRDLASHRHRHYWVRAAAARSPFWCAPWWLQGVPSHPPCTYSLRSQTQGHSNAYSIVQYTGTHIGSFYAVNMCVGQDLQYEFIATFTIRLSLLLQGALYCRGCSNASLLGDMGGDEPRSTHHHSAMCR